MLCTSIVSGIDAGPSPRTCCDGFGYKNLYGAYHPPVVTITDRYSTIFMSLHLELIGPGSEIQYGMNFKKPSLLGEIRLPVSYVITYVHAFAVLNI